MSRRSLVKSAAIISFFTILSRFVGLARTIAEAAVFGRGVVWDAFLVAWMVPNFLRQLFGEGALTGSFIPVFTDYLEKGERREAWRVMNIVFSLLVIVIAALAILCALGIGAALRIFTFPHNLELTLRLTPVLFPYLLFISLCALGAGTLNSFRHFSIPALSPAVLSVVWLLTLIFVCPYFGKTLEDKIYLLAAGILVGGAAQVLILLPPLLQRGMRFHWEVNFNHPGVRTIGRLMLPAVFGLGITQVNLLVDRSIAIFLGSGAVSGLYYGNRLIQFPLGIFGIALGTAVLPTLSGYAARAEMDKLKETFGFALRLVFLIAIPASVGLIVLRYQITRCLFEHGRFTAADTHRVAAVILFYALGLFAYSGDKVLVPTFYSLKATAVPVKVGAVSVLLNVILNFCLMWRMRELGLALATSISGAFNFTVLYLMLRKRVGPLGSRHILNNFFRTTAASAVMGIACFLLANRIDYAVSGKAWLDGLLGLAVPLAGGVVVFAGAAFLLKVEGAELIGKWILRKS